MDNKNKTDKKSEQVLLQETRDGGFARDVAFIKEYTPIVLLERGDSAVAVAPAFQGRIMTSSVFSG